MRACLTITAAWVTVAVTASALGAHNVGTTTPAPSAFSTFFMIGVEHILTGTDHLLLLLGLWLACRSVRPLVWIIIAFTAAHSLSLVAATLDWVRLPDALVEVLIAASIAFVGIENILRRGEPGGRVWLASFFGLIHGLGFSNVLRVIVAEHGNTSIIGPLFGFNLGVETGQLAITVIAFPLLQKLRELHGVGRPLMVWGSALVALAGLFWVVIRLV